MVARQEVKSVLSGPDFGINRPYLLSLPRPWRFRSVGLRWGWGEGRPRGLLSGLQTTGEFSHWNVALQPLEHSSFSFSLPFL